MEKVRVIVWGVGRVGSGAVRMMLNKEWIEMVGAIDVAKEKIGKDLGDVAGTGRKLGIIVSDDADAVFSKTKADMVLHLTAPNVDETETEIMKAIAAGCNVISMADIRLIYPWADYSELGQRIDEVAKKNDVTFLATGRGPGFILDLVPIFFTGVCEHVRKIRIKRVSDAAGRSEAMLKQNGIGLTVEEFKKAVAGGALDYYVSFKASFHMIADALGWKLDEIRQTMEPLTSNKPKKVAEGVQIEPGKVYSWRLLMSGIKEGEEVLSSESMTVIDPKEEGLEVGNTISFEGEPNMEVVVKALNATASVENWAHVVNYIPLVMAAKPGLVTERELPVAAALK